MSLESESRPCEPVEPLGPRRSGVPVWEPVVARFEVTGLRCGHCATRIENALRGSPAVVGAKVDVVGGYVDVLFDATALPLAQIRETVEGAAEGTPRTYVVRKASAAR